MCAMTLVAKPMGELAGTFQMYTERPKNKN